MRKILAMAALPLVMALGLSACSSQKTTLTKTTKSEKLDPFAGKGSPYFKGNGPVPFGGGRYHVGSPYQVAGKWFTPREQPGYDAKGMASWYGEAFHRRMTSNGEWFDMNDLTAAHPTLPIPSYAKVTNLENGREVVVRINDRGPFVGTRLIDLSKSTAEALEFKHKGKASVRVQLIGKAPLNDNGKHLAMMNRKLEQGANFNQLIAAVDTKVRNDDVQVAEAKPKRKIATAGLQQASYDAPAADTTASNATAARSGGYVVQVATLADLRMAQSVNASVAAHGPTRVLETETEAGKAYRVQVGPILDKSDATTALYAVRDGGFPDAKLAKLVIQQVAAP